MTGVCNVGASLVDCDGTKTERVLIHGHSMYVQLTQEEVRVGGEATTQTGREDGLVGRPASCDTSGTFAAPRWPCVCRRRRRRGRRL